MSNLNKTSLFIETNNVQIINKLHDIGVRFSRLCNEGKYLWFVDDMVLQVNHVPYKRHKKYDENEINNFMIDIELQFINNKLK